MGWRDERDDDRGDRDACDVFPGVRCTKETPKAILCTFPEFGGDKDMERWVPKSMVMDASEVWRYDTSTLPSEEKVGDFGKLIVKEWWTERALEEYKTAKKAAALKRAGDAHRAKTGGGGGLAARLKKVGP